MARDEWAKCPMISGRGTGQEIFIALPFEHYPSTMRWIVAATSIGTSVVAGARCSTRDRFELGRLLLPRYARPAEILRAEFIGGRFTFREGKPAMRRIRSTGFSLPPSRITAC
jgi:hypothetical protein